MSSSSASSRGSKAPKRSAADVPSELAQESPQLQPELPYPFSVLKIASTLPALHQLAYTADQPFSTAAARVAWVYLLSLAVYDPPKSTMKHYLPQPGWTVSSRDEQSGEVLTMTAGPVTISPSVYVTLTELVLQGRTLVLQVGTRKMYVPMAEFHASGGRTQSGPWKLDVATLGEAKTDFATALVGFLEGLVTAGTLGPSVALAAAGWRVLRSKTDPACLPELNTVLATKSHAEVLAYAAATLQVTEPTSAAAGLLSTLLSAAAVGKSQTDRWTVFNQLREHVASQPALVSMAEVLELSLPLTPNAVKDYRVEGEDHAWEPVKVAQLPDAAIVPYGPKAAAGQQVLTFIRNPPEAVFTLPSVSTRLLRRTVGGKGQPLRFTDAGTTETLKFQLMSGKLVKQTVAPVITRREAEVEQAPAASAGSYWEL